MGQELEDRLKALEARVSDLEETRIKRLEKRNLKIFKELANHSLRLCELAGELADRQESSLWKSIDPSKIEHT
jgi:uncharacterized coiled-coil protein SlyX